MEEQDFAFYKVSEGNTTVFYRLPIADASRIDAILNDEKNEPRVNIEKNIHSLVKDLLEELGAEKFDNLEAASIRVVGEESF